MTECTTCHCDADDTWPGDNGEVCQNCWEAECSRSWWEMVNKIAEALAK